MEPTEHKLEDRHLNNFGVLKNTADHSYRFPPLFDNGYALGFMQAEQKPVQQYLYSCKAKPFSTSFAKQLHLIQKLPRITQTTTSSEFGTDGYYAQCWIAVCYAWDYCHGSFTFVHAK